MLYVTPTRLCRPGLPIVRPAQQVFAARDWSRDLLQVSLDTPKFSPKNIFAKFVDVFLIFFVNR